ncbi:N-6 DNA methylase [Marinilactibacillus psychrotolerans]|uniref:N-6 DNA methylase n=1 Tax=Marinilactibacillus psychrotolerans TaxID=191770 RepID=UPI00388A7A4E
MISNELINQLLDIKESYKAPDRMMELMINDVAREKTFKQFLNQETDLSYEWFQGYFESEHADRKEKKQDFTPNSVSELGAMILGKSDQYFEATVGTGGMMIQFWNKNPDAYFEVEELSDRAIPFLLFNMSIRGMNGLVKHGDSLRQEFFAIYELTGEGKFSEIKRR